MIWDEFESVTPEKVERIPCYINSDTYLLDSDSFWVVSLVERGGGAFGLAGVMVCSLLNRFAVDTMILNKYHPVFSFPFGGSY